MPSVVASALGADQNDAAALYFDLLKKVLTGFLYDESAWLLLEPATKAKTPYAIIKKAVLKLLAKRKLHLVKWRPFDSDARAGGTEWPMVGYTMVGLRRLDNLQACIEQVLARNIPGDFIECGVWRGGASIFARAVFKFHGVDDRKVWLADSFEGMPVPTKDDLGDPDLSGVSYLSIPLEQVKANFQRFGLLDDQVRFIKGWFSDTLPTAPIEKVCILRLDGDHYSSTMDALGALYDKVSPGGFIIIDDYDAFPSCSIAVTRFFKDRKINPELKRIDTHSVFWQKGGIT